MAGVFIFRSGSHVRAMAQSESDPLAVAMENANKIVVGLDLKRRVRGVVEIPHKFVFDVEKYKMYGTEVALDEKLRLVGFDFPYQTELLLREREGLSIESSVLCCLYHLSFGSWVLFQEKTKENLGLIMGRLLGAVAIDKSEFSRAFFFFAFKYVVENHKDLVDGSLFSVVEKVCSDNALNDVGILAVSVYLEHVAADGRALEDAALSLLCTLCNEDVNLLVVCKVCETIASTSLFYVDGCLECMCTVIALTKQGSFGCVFSNVCQKLFDVNKHSYQEVQWPEGNSVLIELPQVPKPSPVECISVLSDVVNRLNMQQGDEMPEYVDYWNLYVPKEVQTAIEVLANRNTSSYYAIDLVNAASVIIQDRVGDPHFGALASAYVGMCVKLISQETGGILQFVLKSEVFNPRITMFDCDKSSFALVHSLRKDIMTCMRNSSRFGVLEIYELFLRKPVILVELFRRLRDDVQLNLKICDDMPSSSMLSNIFIYYSSVAQLHDGYENECVLVLSEFVQLVLDLLRNPMGRTVFVLSTAFQPVVYHMFHETSLRSILVAEVQKVFMALPCHMAFNVKVFFSMMMDSISKKLQADGSLEMIQKILQLLSENGPEDPSFSTTAFVSSFTSIIEMVVMVLARLPKSEQAKCVFFSGLECMTKLCVVEKFSDDLVGKLQDSIITLFGKDCDDDQLFLRMLQLLKGKVEDPVAANFVVSNGKLLRLVVDLFITSRHSPELIPFLHGLLKHVANVQVCREHEIEVLLLKKVAHLKKRDLVQDQALIASLLGLFRTIAITRASARSVKQYITLFTATPNGVLSIHQGLFMHELRNIVMDEYNLGFIAESKWRTFGDPELLNKGFTLFLWIRPHVGTLDDILTVNCGKTHMVLSIEDFAVKLNLATLDETLEFSLMKVEEGLWSLVSLSFQASQDCTQVIPQCGLEYVPSFEIPKLQFDIIDGLVS